MADGLNLVILTGNLGADPDLRYTQSGTAVLTFNLATTESYLDANKQRQEDTQWHRVTVWKKRAEGLSKILAKGSKLQVVGKIRYSKYEDKEGVERWTTEIVARQVVLCGGPNPNGTDATKRRPPGPAPKDEDIPVDFGSDDDISF